MCYKCRRHMHFIADCHKAVENKVEQKHRPRTEHKYHSRNHYKGKNKSERRPRKSGCHKKKTKRAMVSRVSDIHSISYCTSRVQTMKKKMVIDTRASGRVRNSIVLVLHEGITKVKQV
jgi:hypothetical protein